LLSFHFSRGAMKRACGASNFARFYLARKPAASRTLRRMILAEAIIALGLNWKASANTFEGRRLPITTEPARSKISSASIRISGFSRNLGDEPDKSSGRRDRCRGQYPLGEPFGPSRALTVDRVRHKTFVNSIQRFLLGLLGFSRFPRPETGRDRAGRRERD
jgi:hypothetical protein